MPVPQFWPEKATEWVALIGGSLGGLLGTAAFVLSVLNYRRDRARLHFFAKQETYYPDKETEQDAAGIYTPDSVIFKLRVTNFGRRPIRIESAWALLHGVPLLLALEPEKKDAAGIVLTESEPTAIYMSCPLKPERLIIEDVVRFEVCDSAYRTYRYYHRNYVLTHIRQALHPLRARLASRRLLKPRRIEITELD